MSTTAGHLRSLEEALLNPALRRNRAAVENLLTQDFVEFGSSGRVWTRDQITELLANQPLFPVRIDDFNCVLLTETVALVTYRAVRCDTATGTGISSLRSSIWMRISGEWRCRFHQGTRSS
jgi:hypothetical protein